MTVYICMCCFLYGGTSLHAECLVYSVVAQGPPHLASGMGFLKLESLKNALGETWMLIGWRSCGEQYLDLHVNHCLEELTMINSH